ncbi:MAG: glucosamine-6-phosphate deaminase [Spirochaetia bacterium]
MRVVIHQNYEQISLWLAQHIAKRINDFNPSASKPFVLGLATGSSPIRTYEHLAAMNKRGEVSFEHVVTFNMDEYVGLPQSHPESYYSFMWKHLFDHINIKKENVHILNGNAKDLEKECADYEKAIQNAGGVELFIGGIGVDGHLAFNEPGTSLHSRTHVQKLTHETRLVNSRFFDHDISQVPQESVTVGVATVTDSREVSLIISGHNKARALRHTVEEGVSHMWTASALQLHPNAIIVCDEESCSELKVGTYKYFKEMEKL